MLATGLAVSCSDNSPTAPTPSAPPAPAHATIAIESMNIAGQRAGASTGEYVYRIVVRLRETGGVAATITAVDLTFMNGANVLTASHHEQPVPDTANVCPASGSVDTRELVTVDAESHPHATTVQAKVAYRDATGMESSTSRSGDVPPFDEPPRTYSLSGAISDQATTRAIVGARVEVLNGANTGLTAVADSAGLYTLTGLVGGTFRLRASAAGYEPGEQNVTVPDILRADFQLRRTGGPDACAYAVAPSGFVDVGFSGGQLSVSMTRTSGDCGWRAVSDVAWITPASISGTGTSLLTLSYRPNAAFVGRIGSVSIEWNGGRAQVTVRQAAETPAFCRIVTVTVDGRSTIDVTAAGGQFTAMITPEPGTPPGVCGNWTASASAGITLAGQTTGPSLPASLTFVVQANPVATVRSMSVTVTLSGRTAGLTVNQAGKP
jgi:hypothetical protein